MAPASGREDAIGFLVGEVHALFMFCQALAMTHQDPQVLLSCLDQAEQEGLASLEMLPVQSDGVIEGFQFAIGGIRKAAKAAAGNQ
jgi:hypothetical protein